MASKLTREEVVKLLDALAVVKEKQDAVTTALIEDGDAQDDLNDAQSHANATTAIVALTEGELEDSEVAFRALVEGSFQVEEVLPVVP